MPSTREHADAVKTFLTNLPYKLHYLFLFIAGCLSALALAPLHLWLFFFVGFGYCFTLLLKNENTLRAFLIPFFFILGFHVTGLYWISNAVFVRLSEFWWVLPLSTLGLPIVLATLTSVHIASATLISRNNLPMRFWSLVLMFTVSEYIKEYIFTGFPWNLYGMIWPIESAMASLNTIGGIYFVTALTIFLAACPALIFSGYTRHAVQTWLCFVFMFFIGVAAYWQQTSISFSDAMEKKASRHVPVMTLNLIQPNIKQSEKWKDDELIAHTNLRLSLSQEAIENPPLNTYTGLPYDNIPNVIIWPETALITEIDNHSEFQEELKSALGDHENYFISGILKTEENSSYSNTMLIRDMQSMSDQYYSKFHLVPFGEYMPLSDIIPLGAMVGIEGFAPGDGVKTIKLSDSLPEFQPVICYEILFTRYFLNNPAEWIINVTNDGWYGDTAGPRQHLYITQLRALEHGKPIVRVAGTGISAIIDHRGRIKESINYNQQSVISQAVEIKPAKTYYTANGFSPLKGLVLLAFCFILISCGTRKHYFFKGN